MKKYDFKDLLDKNKTSLQQQTKMGRPPIKGEKKDQKITAYLTKTEYTLLESVAAESDLSVSNIVRKATLAYIKTEN